MNAEHINPETVWNALATVPDPEFGINVVDLGLIYSVECTEAEVAVVMTLTTPTCPSGAWIHEGVKAALGNVPGIQSLRVDLVFEPPWSTDMLSAAARQQLGWQPPE